jgi:hypothetical protein
MGLRLVTMLPVRATNMCSGFCVIFQSQQRPFWDGRTAEAGNNAICAHFFEGSGPETLIVQEAVIGTVSWLCPSNYEGGYYRDGLKYFLMFDESLRYLKAQSLRPVANI